MTARCLIAGVLVGVLVTACSNRDDSQPTAPTPPASTSSTTPSTATTPTATAPSPTTLGQQIRALQHVRTPNARDIIALTKSPTVWRVAHNRVLAGYTVPVPVDWPDSWSGPAAWQVLDREGRLLGQWAQRTAYTYVPAGRYFVGLQPSYFRVPEPFGDARKAVLVRRGAPTPLTLLPGQRSMRRADLRVDGGWLLDPSRLTITREALPRWHRGSSRLDPTAESGV